MTVETQAQGRWWVPPGDAPVPSYCVALGATLRQLRRAAGRSVADVASDILGTTKQQLARYESGAAKPSLEIVSVLCGEYGVNPIEVVTRTAVLTDPDAAGYRTWPPEARFWWIMLTYDTATGTRRELDRKRAERLRRRQAGAEDTTPR